MSSQEPGRKESVRTRLVELIATVLGIDPALVTDDLSPERTESWDSLNHLSICMALGQEFGIELTTQQIAGISCVRDIVALLQSHGVA